LCYGHLKTEKLPEHLQPIRIDCGTGLRTRAVQALFHQYGELKSRLVTVTGVSSCMDALLFHWCSSVWFHQKIKKDTKIWMFYFKLSSEKTRGSHTNPRRFSKKWLNTVDFLRDNPNDGFIVLAVSCLNFISFQPVIGMVLTEALVGVSQGMKHCRVKLMFHSHRKDKRYRPESGYQVILDPVQDVRVLKWWHSLYPT
ncbi:transmembrane protein 183-like, partial [Actinia tenebrosa]|uniref:Transmembrane protein 183-like n=1 Tax=Actinia tenebrosa TaxID=6105 RepID=A0A6P8HAZ4_ACTTE